ncbi:hypothetical protein KIN20_034389 [Parelaphostrongylus tenuis]|uniref:3-hydroxyacyl-CoA dehydrogenase NAD binding domain-containing protein n=1 Tax=Parelaphostrongylus tenuis TaxID=148309 RepID=A0AAD5R9J3_PARTN|nr:hypothetical protein KIN20_034389 [Parelaphostrongylus tenuis]
MASAVVVGQGKLAAKITNILCTSGIPVAFYGMDKPFRESVEQMLHTHTETTIPLQFVDDLRHQQDMYARLLENLRMTDDISRLFGEVIIDTTRTTNSPLLRAVRRFVSEAPVMSIGGTAADENTVSVHLYEPFEVTRIAKIVPSARISAASLERVRALLNNAKIAEVTEEQGDLAERALNAWRNGDNSMLQLHKLIARIVPSRSIASEGESVML